MIRDVVFLSIKPEIPPESYWEVYWDMNLLKTLLSGLNFHQEIGDLKEAIVIIAGATQAQEIEAINAELAKLDKCKVIITSDESNLFPAGELEHPNMTLFSQYPTDNYNAQWLPLGSPVNRQVEIVEKDLKFFFSGQVTHSDRKECVKALRGKAGKIIRTDGFAKGVPQQEYYSYMDRAKIAPCPNGTVSPDSFRVYEAIEAGCIPVVKDWKYWNYLIPPFVPRVKEWKELKNVKYDAHVSLQLQAWWRAYRTRLRERLVGDPEVTVVIPVSPIKSHPSTHILDETIESVRMQLPDARIIVTFDGVRDEQKHKTSDYNLFIRRAIAKHEIFPMIFSGHTHQVGMMRAALPLCTQYIVYVEHDTPFTSDYINWQDCKDSLEKVDLIRFHFFDKIPEEHEYLMMGKTEDTPAPLLLTKQWSQRPHLTTKPFYAKVLSSFSVGAKSFIEDHMHSLAQEHPNEFRLAIYMPEGSIKRSYHLDGREGEKKYDDTQIF